MDRNQIASPVDFDDSGWRGRVRGVTRISTKAGFAAGLVLAVLFGMIVYGISTAGQNRASNVGGVAALTKASERQAPWWSNVPDTPPQAPTLAAAEPHVPDLAAAEKQADLERESRKQAALDAAVGSPVLVRPGGAAALPQPGIGVAPSIEPVGGVAGQAAQTSDGAAGFLTGASRVSRDRILAIRQDDPSPYVIRAGSVIPATLVTGINADLPGTIVGQVRDDVFDSVTGAYLLIPRGTKLVGSYDSRIVQGQRRVLVAWTRLLYPDGSSIDIGAMAGTDPAGYAGFGANVDEHLNKAINAALLMSLITAGAQLSQPQQAASIYAAPGIGQTLAGSAGQQLANTSAQLTQRELQIRPTLEVPPGYLFNVLVDRDIVMVAPYTILGAP